MAEIIDIFDSDPFRATTLTASINKRPFMPGFLGSLGIFTQVPIRTQDASVAITDMGSLKVVQTTRRRGPPYEETIPLQNLRPFRTPRIAVADTINSWELQGIISRNVWMAAPDFTLILQDLASEIAFRLDGPIGLQAKMSVTKERHRLGAISGQVLDADGSILYDWPTLLGMTLPAPIAFNLSAANPPPGTLATLVRQTKRSMLRAAKIGNEQLTRIIGLCGDQFFDNLVSHPDVITSWNQFQVSASATALVRIGAPLPMVGPFDTFPWAGIEWVNYRGTDDQTAVNIATNVVKFIIVYPGLFQEVLSPGENFAFMNEPGLPVYAEIIPDRERNRYVRLEVSSYPAYVPTRPDLLFSGTA